MDPKTASLDRTELSPVRQPRLLAITAVALATIVAGSLPGQELRLRDRTTISTAVHDPERNRLVAIDRLGATLEFDGTRWRQRGLSRLPVNRHIVRDTANQRLLAIGPGAFGNFGATHVFAFDGVAWNQVTPTFSNPGMVDAASAYDDARSEVLLFGGSGQSIEPTWVFDGANWSYQTLTPSPPPRFGTTMSYDSQRARVVLFGGLAGLSTLLNDTWEWNGTAWTQVTTATSPPPRWKTSMAFDPLRNRTVLFGGLDLTAARGDGFEFDGTNWQAITTGSPLPGARGDAALTFDPSLGECVLIGGDGDTGALQDTWSFDGVRWRLLDTVAQPSFHPDSPAMVSPNGDHVVLLKSNGTAAAETWLWDGSTWTQSPGAVPSPRSFALSCTGPTMSYVYGGFDTATNTDRMDLWGWNGTAWNQLPGQVPVGKGGAIAFDWARNELVLFGGAVNFTALDETWVFDGTSWQRRQPATIPPARWDQVMAYDFVRQRIVMFGGGNAAFRDTWEWDGTNWTQVVTPNQPPAGLASMAYDLHRDRIVMVQPAVNGPTTAMWVYDGQDWSSIAITDPLPSILARRTPLVGAPYSDGLLLVEYHNLFSLSTREAHTEHFGSACTGNAPDVTVDQWPRPGTAGFGLEVVRAPGSSLIALLGATQSASVTIGGCTQLVQPGQAVVLLPTTSTGFATMPLPLPGGPAFVGVDLFFQAAALDASAPSGFTMSRGLQVTIGD